MGSLVHATGARKRNENIIAMLCLECLGVYSDEPNSQYIPIQLERYPRALVDQVFPDTANFIAFCSNIDSYPLLRQCVMEFRETTLFPSEAIATSKKVIGISWSDHWSFWNEGYSAIMITDTAFLRYNHYHNSSDTPDKLDYERMARVTEGLKRVIQKLLD
jgi:Zn-dependent M28 family amino/carboxypeptidase